jgi:hypothetical protein
MGNWIVAESSWNHYPGALAVAKKSGITGMAVRNETSTLRTLAAAGHRFGAVTGRRVLAHSSPALFSFGRIKPQIDHIGEYSFCAFYVTQPVQNGHMRSITAWSFKIK